MDAHRDRDAEQKVLDRAIEKSREPRPFVPDREEAKHLYDIGKSLETPFDQMRHKDGFYSITTKPIGEEKRMGPFRTVSQEVGEGVWRVPNTKRQFSRVQATKAFYDKSHLQST